MKENNFIKNFKDLKEHQYINQLEDMIEKQRIIEKNYNDALRDSDELIKLLEQEVSNLNSQIELYKEVTKSVIGSGKNNSLRLKILSLKLEIEEIKYNYNEKVLAKKFPNFKNDILK